MAEDQNRLTLPPMKVAPSEVAISPGEPGERKVELARRPCPPRSSHLLRAIPAKPAQALDSLLRACVVEG
jgi:hypothetical protein